MNDTTNFEQKLRDTYIEGFKVGRPNPSDSDSDSEKKRSENTKTRDQNKSRDLATMEICGRYQSDKPGGGTYEFTSFTTYFAEYQLPKLSDSFSMVESALAEHGITYKLDLVKRYIIVITNERTKDPDMIHRARELIRLLSKTNVSPSMAIEILNGNLHHDFIKTGHQDGGLSKIHGITDERFAKRRNRFVKNLKDLARLLGCYLFVNGNSVTAVGTSLVHVMVVRKIVERCFVDNVNPAAVVNLLNTRKEELNVEKKLQDLRI